MLEEAKDWIAAAIAGGWLTLLTWFGKRQIERLDTLENGKANKVSTDKRFDDLHSDLKEISSKLDSTNQLLHQTNANIAHLSGRFEQANYNNHQ